MYNKSKIIRVRKNSDGDIVDIMTDSGDIYSVNEAIVLANYGLIDGVSVGLSRNGREYIRSNPNNTTLDNLDSLPLF